MAGSYTQEVAFSLGHVMINTHMMGRSKCEGRRVVMAREELAQSEFDLNTEDQKAAISTSEYHPRL